MSADELTAIDVAMPRLSDSMEEAEVLAWLKSPGDVIARGEPLVEIETDKATIVYEAEIDGILEEILVGAGEVAALGVAIARIRVAGPFTRTPAPPTSNGPQAAAAETVRAPMRPAHPERVRATPVARRTAQKLGVTLTGVRGSGPSGRIINRDVLARHEGAAVSALAPNGRRSTLTATQRTIARRMGESHRDIPEFTVVREVDMTAAVEAREQMRRVGEAPLSLNDFVVGAVARTLRQVPDLNVSFDGDEVVHHDAVHVGVAVAIDEALLVPTIFDADRMTIFEIAANVHLVVERARARQASVEELSGATFTVSNLGMFGVTSFTAVINPPQAAILAVGAARPLPRFDAAGELVSRQIMELSLTCDHRVVYGATAARFLAGLTTLLENPLALVLPPAVDTTKGN